MGNIRGYEQYKEQSITTMTKSEMLIFLYDEVIKRLTKAKILGYNKEYTEFEREIVRAREIINYFEQTLDRRYPVSAGLSKMYDFINYELARALAGRNVDIVDEVMPFLIELRDTWREADKLSRVKSS